MDAHGLEPAERVSAAKKLGREEAREILEASSRVIVAKGRRLERFETGGAEVLHADDEALLVQLEARLSSVTPLVCVMA